MKISPASATGFWNELYFYGANFILMESTLFELYNIAEGNTQLFIKRELFHANAALGSCGETRNHLLTAYQYNYISKEQYKILDEKFLEIIKMLYGYIKRLKSNLDNESDAAEP